MTRETKVGLIIGLGVILLVGIIVSDYAFVEESQDSSLTQDYGQFQSTSTQDRDSARFTPGDAAHAIGNDPRSGAAVVLGDIERGHGQSDESRTHTPEPRDGPITLGGSRRGFGGSVAIEQPIQRPIVGARQQDTTPTAGRLETHRVSPRENDDPAVVPGPLEPEVPVLDATRDLIANTPPTQGRIIHLVREDENLSQIAREYYDGDANMWRSIRNANPGLVGPNGEVRAGIEIMIPKRGGTAADPEDDRTRHVEVHSRARSTGQPGRRRVRIVVMKTGDTLSDIAAEHLGSARRWPEIVEANPDVITNPDAVPAGTRLRLPAEPYPIDQVVVQAQEALELDPPERTTTTTTTTTTAGRTYTVVTGDSLYRIAANQLGSGERYTEIFEANKDQLDSPDDLTVGMVLKLPAQSVARAGQ